VITRRSILKGFGEAAVLLAAGLGPALAKAAESAGHGAQTVASAETGAKVTKLLEQPLPDMGNRVMHAVLVEVAPGVEERPHHHLGPAFVYILDGSITVRIGSSPAKIYQAGEMYYEPPLAIHRENTKGQSSPCRFLALLILRRGDPLVVLENASA
jgi:quercetin dioxygenase-like cupin family protein